jgi:hypothetical protein
MKEEVLHVDYDERGARWFDDGTLPRSGHGNGGRLCGWRDHGPRQVVCIIAEIDPVVVYVSEKGGVGCRERDVLVRCDYGGRCDGQGCRSGKNWRNELHAACRTVRIAEQTDANRMLNGRDEKPAALWQALPARLLYRAITRTGYGCPAWFPYFHRRPCINLFRLQAFMPQISLYTMDNAILHTGS